jgi:predicted TIM-barrel fold metal-dependent hydrolase
MTQIFDCHVHLPSPGLGYSLEWSSHTKNLEEAVNYLRICGVDRIVANNARGILAKTAEEMVAGNNEVIQAAEKYPDFIVPACLTNTNFYTESLNEIRRCHDEHHIIWLGEITGYLGGFSYETNAFKDAINLATQINMIVQIHDDDTKEMERLCILFPDTTFILAHLGDSTEEVKARIDLTKHYPNLYLDISGHGYQRMGVLELAVDTAGPDRVLFGSDFTINDPSGVISRIENANFDLETKSKILGNNLLRLLSEHGMNVG